MPLAIDDVLANLFEMLLRLALVADLRGQRATLHLWLVSAGTMLTWAIRQGHVLELLRAMPAESVHCVVTSPPYFGLRSYKTEPQVWGGQSEHLHDWQGQESLSQSGGSHGIGPAYNENRKFTSSSSSCACGAWRGELGLEPTPELYVQHLVEVFQEVKRVLRSDGSCWINLGDSYAGSQKGMGADGTAYGGQKQRTNAGSLGLPVQSWGSLKPKDLCGMPWRVAFALQADGWWLRSDIIWAKPNPMPESVTDRPTKAHEYVFLLTKSAQYYFDQEAVREPDHPDGRKQTSRKQTNRYQGETFNQFQDRKHERWTGSRNFRTVWTIPTQAFPGAHFATFPEKLVEPCIRAGTSEKGCCAMCGASWERKVNISYEKNRPSAGDDPRSRNDDRLDEARGHGGWRGNNLLRKSETPGWHPTCSCQAETIPCVVLDPFCGSGTTGIVALKLGRSFLGLELQLTYVEMAKRRIEAVMPLFAAVS